MDGWNNKADLVPIFRSKVQELVLDLVISEEIKLTLEILILQADPRIVLQVIVIAEVVLGKDLKNRFTSQATEILFFHLDGPVRTLVSAVIAKRGFFLFFLWYDWFHQHIKVGIVSANCSKISWQ